MFKQSSPVVYLIFSFALKLRFSIHSLSWPFFFKYYKGPRFCPLVHLPFTFATMWSKRYKFSFLHNFFILKKSPSSHGSRKGPRLSIQLN